MPRGKSPPCPEVTSTSPTWRAVPSRARYLNRSVPRGSAPPLPRGPGRPTGGPAQGWGPPAVPGGPPPPAPPLARDDPPGGRRQRQALRERQEGAEPPVLVVG